jgi:elongation factor G
MKLAVEGPSEFQGAYIKTIMQRRGQVIGTTEEEGDFCRVEAEVPLADMFGYATDLRSASQGKAEFTMEFARYVAVPGEVSDELKKQYADQATKTDEDD